MPASRSTLDRRRSALSGAASRRCRHVAGGRCGIAGRASMPLRGTPRRLSWCRHPGDDHAWSQASTAWSSRFGPLATARRARSAPRRPARRVEPACERRRRWRRYVSGARPPHGRGDRAGATASAIGSVATLEGAMLLANRSTGPSDDERAVTFVRRYIETTLGVFATDGPAWRRGRSPRSLVRRLHYSRGSDFQPSP